MSIYTPVLDKSTLQNYCSKAYCICNGTKDREDKVILKLSKEYRCVQTRQKRDVQERLD